LCYLHQNCFLKPEKTNGKLSLPSKKVCIQTVIKQNKCVGKNAVKVKCILVQAMRLCTGRMAHRGSRGIAIPFLDHGTRRG
jgi:hypothetical protein